MCQDKKLNDAVLKNLQAAGKKGGLAGIEIIEGVVVAPDEWTPQNVSYSCETPRRIMTDWLSATRYFCTEAQPQRYS